MRARATITKGLTASVSVRDHQLKVDEPADVGGTDEGPTPQELLAAALGSCTAMTMQMYAIRKGWDVSGLQVDCEYAPAGKGCMTRFALTLGMPAHLSEEQVAKLQVIAAKCPIHRTLEGEVCFDEDVRTLAAPQGA